jgi:hypothetical protein
MRLRLFPQRCCERRSLCSHPRALLAVVVLCEPRTTQERRFSAQTRRVGDEGQAVMDNEGVGDGSENLGGEGREGDTWGAAPQGTRCGVRESPYSYLRLSKIIDLQLCNNFY